MTAVPPAVKPKAFTVEGFVTEHKGHFASTVLRRDDVAVAWMDVTPALAQKWLDKYNFENRRLRGKRVEKYASDQAANRWLETGEPIILCSDGLFASAQHRLAAQIQSGKTIRYLVVVGVSPMSRRIVDSGAPKCFADRLQAQGVASSIAVATGYRMKALYDKGSFETKLSVSDTQLANLMRLQPLLAEYVQGINNVPRGYGGRSLWGWLMYEFDMKDKKLAAEFYDQVVNGVDVQRESNAYFLRRRLDTAPLHEARGSSIPVQIIGAFIVKSWNAERCGKSAQVLKFLKGEKFPEIM